MLRHFSFFLLILFISGCATTHPNVQSDSKPQPIKASTTKQSHALENVKNEAVEQYAQQKGIIFGEAEFLGVLDADYVRLHFVGMGANKHEYDLNIRPSIPTQKNNVTAVEPGYFFLELPAGIYKIVSVSIPVGSTMAVESIDIDLKVIPNAVTYIGFLKVDGTKERIKLGGVPVIRPGFEYVAQVSDESAEAIQTFYKKYPNYKQSILVGIMKLNELPSDVKKKMPAPLAPQKLHIPPAIPEPKHEK